MLRRDIFFFKKIVTGFGRRNVVIPSRAVKKRKRKVSQQISDAESFTLDKRINAYNSQELTTKLKQLEEFTKQLRNHVQLADSLTKKEKIHRELQEQAPDSDSYDDAKLFLDSSKLIREGESRMVPLDVPLNSANLSSLILSSSHQARTFLPKELLERINDNELVVKSLIDKQNRNWNTIVDRLYNSNKKLDGISLRSLKTSLLNKVNHLSLTNIKKLDEMLMSNISHDLTRYNIAMYECIFSNLSNLKPSKSFLPSDKTDYVFETMEKLLLRFDEAKAKCSADRIGDEDSAISNTPKLAMSQFILNCCIKYASKTVNINKVNFFLTKFSKDYGIQPNKENYTTIIQFYNKLGLNKDAWDLFTTMKFLSSAHNPDVTTYNTMLNICSKEKNYAKAIDLLNEMHDLGVKPSAQTLSLMAKTLAKASSDPISSEGKSHSLRLLGWKYIHQIENDPELQNGKGQDHYLKDTLTAMMALGAYDGDVGLTRALYFTYVSNKFKESIARWKSKFGTSIPVDYKKVWRNALDPYLFNYLLLSYANHNPDKTPLLLEYPQGRILRRNVMNSADYVSRNEQPEEINVKIPMLPIANINKTWQIIAESRAMWQFNLEFGGTVDLAKLPEDCSPNFLTDLMVKTENEGEFTFQLLHQIARWKARLVNHEILNTKSLTTFLTIPIKLGDKREFLSRISEFTYEQQEFDRQVDFLFDSQNKLSPAIETSNDTDRELIHLDQIDKTFCTSFFVSMKHKLLRSSMIYELIMKAATKFHDSELASECWVKRGQFRKTSAFQRLTDEEKTATDSTFASLMVDFFTQEHKLTDAMAIIMTSQKYINWTYNMVKNLHKELVMVEDTESTKILLQIVNKK